jgi:hypothetical protein
MRNTPKRMVDGSRRAISIRRLPSDTGELAEFIAVSLIHIITEKLGDAATLTSRQN